MTESECVIRHIILCTFLHLSGEDIFMYSFVFVDIYLYFVFVAVKPGAMLSMAWLVEYCILVCAVLKMFNQM